MPAVKSCLWVAAIATFAVPAWCNPEIRTVNGDLHINSTDSSSSLSGRVLVNGVDVLQEIASLSSTVTLLNTQLQNLTTISYAQYAVIRNLTLFQTASLERLRILELTNAPTPYPTSQAPTSAAPTSRAPTAPDGSSASSAGTSCYTLYQAGNRRSGSYYIDVDGPGGSSPRRMTCDMSGQGGYNVQTVARQGNVPGRHASAASSFSVSNYGYSTTRFRFGYVTAQYQFAGELDDSNNYVTSYFNGRQVSRYRNGRCNSSPITPTGWPMTSAVNANSFSIRAQPSGDVDVTCGSIYRYGRNYFTLQKAQIIPV